MNVFVFGVDDSTRCGPLSNVDFVYFVWQNFERTTSKQYAITLIPLRHQIPFGSHEVVVSQILQSSQRWMEKCGQLRQLRRRVSDMRAHTMRL